MAEPSRTVAPGNPAVAAPQPPDPAAYLQQVLSQRRTEDPEFLQRHLVLMLASPDKLDDETATTLARLAKRECPLLDVWLARAIGQASSGEVRRILRLLDQIADSNRILVFLMPALRTGDEAIRSKAALLFARFCQSPKFAEQFRHNGDSRVFANAIEGLWGLKHPDARLLLRAATVSTDNRTMANAALGLLKIGDEQGLAVLKGMAQHQEDVYRASAAWAMGETRRPACLPVLHRLSLDPSPIVAKNAKKAVEKISARVGGPPK